MKKLLIRQCRLVSPGVDLPQADILLDGDSIAAVSEKPMRVCAERVIDAEGLIAMPGFIDIHCHGRSNMDFSDESFEAFQTIGRDKLQDGVTSFLATTMTLPQQVLLNVARLARRYAEEVQDGATLLGLHLEGPFFPAACAGAQNPAYLKNPDISPVLEINDIFPVVKVSFAPELPGALELTKRLRRLGIMPSGGHTAADYECFEQHRKAGMKHLTHFCNVMTPVHHLRFGMVGAGLMDQDVFVEMICDGVHLSDPMIQLIAKCKGSRRMMLITDAIRASGMPDGDNYSLGGLPVIVKHGKATLADGKTVAGSTLRYYNGLKKLIAVTGMPLKHAVCATSWNQAKSLRIPRRGKIEPGFLGDIVLTNQNLEPEITLCQGRVAFETRCARERRRRAAVVTSRECGDSFSSRS